MAIAFKKFVRLIDVEFCSNVELLIAEFWSELGVLSWFLFVYNFEFATFKLKVGTAIEEAAIWGLWGWFDPLCTLSILFVV